MPEEVRLQLRTGVNPDKFEFAGDNPDSPALPVEDKRSLKQYHFQDSETIGTTDYVGKAKIDGTWLIIRYLNGDTARMANISNNPTIETYEEAFTAKESLNYDYIFNLTI